MAVAYLFGGGRISYRGGATKRRSRQVLLRLLGNTTKTAE
jgi:hypothetical protein